MGDRANVVVDQEHGKGSIFLYTHWGGTELPKNLQTALAREWRWNDESYLARIIFQEMTGPRLEETGFGISTYPPDNDAYPYLRVSTKTQTVTVDFDPVRRHNDKPNRQIPFTDFITIPDIDWSKLGLT